jgi:hypothetical protein
MRRRGAGDFKMRLVGQHGVSFDLVIEGYESPEATDYWDNWVYVIRSGAVCNWRLDLPAACLETFEVRALADWLESVSRGRPSAEACTFTEPKLAFEYRSAPHPAVLIRFSHGCEPTWPGPDWHDRRFTLSFDLFLNDLAAAASDLRAFLATFPERGEEPECGTAITHWEPTH